MNNLTPGRPGANNVISSDRERTEQEGADKYSVQSQRRWAEEKKYFERTHQVIENKGAHDKFTEKTRTFWFNFRTFWFKCRTFWFNVVTFWRGHAAFPIRT
jgi:hypothetical protein